MPSFGNSAIYSTFWRDVKVRYKQTVLGVAWAVLQPAMMMFIFYIIFTVVTNTYHNDDMPYPLFVFSAHLPWTFFATAIANAGNNVIGSERLITKIKLGFVAVRDEIDEIDRALRFTVTEGQQFGSGRGHHRGVCVAASQWSFAAHPPLSPPGAKEGHA